MHTAPTAVLENNASQGRLDGRLHGGLTRRWRACTLQGSPMLLSDRLHDSPHKPCNPFDSRNCGVCTAQHSPIVATDINNKA